MSFVHDAEACAVTAILPEHRLQDVIEEVISPLGLKALSWRARGTLLKDSWLQRFLPPISRRARTIANAIFEGIAADVFA
ncbi:MAG: hypothetical protein AAGF46_05600, partial [Pseudomonadota bacterium]